MMKKVQTTANDDVESYRSWKAAKLTHMVATITKPSDEIEWQEVAYFPSSTTYTSAITGDTWYEGHVDGNTVYRCSDGVLEVYYGPREFVYKWSRNEWQTFVAQAGEIEAARTMLLQTTVLPQNHPDYEQFTRLVEADGVDLYIALASAEVWLIPEDPNNPKQVDWYITTAERYDVPYVLLQYVCDGADLDAVRRFNLDCESVWENPRTGEHFVLTRGKGWINLHEALRMVMAARAGSNSSLTNDAGDVEGLASTDQQTTV